MVDYVAVLRRTIDALPKNTPEIRERVYAKARTTVESKLAMINPPPSQALIARQMSGLETAISTVEADFTIAEEPEALSAAIAEETDPLLDVLRGLPSLSSALGGTPESKTATPFRLPAVESPDFEAAYLPPAPVGVPDALEEAPQPARLPQAATLRNNELPSENEPFDDVFAQQVESPVSLPFAVPSLDEPLLVPMFARRARPKANPIRVLLPLAGLALLAGISAFAWTKRDTIIALLKPEQTPVVAGQPDGSAQPTPVPADEPPVAPAETGEATAQPAQNSAQKFTQRLNTDGTEIDAGAGTAGGAQSVAQLEPSAEPAGSGAPLVEPPVGDPAAPPATEIPAPAAGAIAVGQKAIFYEERTSGAEGSARSGDVVWSIVRESPGNDLPPEPAVRGELSIPEAGLNVRMTLRRNADTTLPASHILELIMTVPDDFSGGTIEDVQRVNLKPTEESAGAPLAATPVKVADKYFLVALENTPAVVETNLKLLRDLSWIDLPVVYRSGRRALFTMEKGLIGDQIFKEVIDAWAAAPLQ